MESPKRHKSNEDEDMISNLPDFIIGRILSLLPTKDAVSTSVLSKSWIYKWTFITQLKFKDKEWSSSKKIRNDLFVSFVYRVLLHLNSSSIQSFALTISDEYESSHVDQWISAVSRRVRKLYVYSVKKGNLSSHSLMKYKSLEILILVVDSCNIRVPPFAYFPYLAHLHLCGIDFIGGTSNDSGNIHLDFPLLRTYRTINCTWSSSVKFVTLKVPQLKLVSIKDFRRRSPSNDSHTAIKFCASDLTIFSYSDYLLPDTIVFDLSAAIIASAIIDIHGHNYEEENEQEAAALSSKLLKQFTNVKSLRFQRSEEVLPLAKDSLEDLPTYEKLSHLELGKVTTEILLALLQKSPNLKTLIFLELLQVDQELLNYDHVCDCILTTLQVVKFLRFDGSDHQLSFAKFVMANGVALKRMSFIPTLKLRNSKLEEVKKKLFSFEKCVCLSY